jgi:hypothetical protein
MSSSLSSTTRIRSVSGTRFRSSSNLCAMGGGRYGVNCLFNKLGRDLEAPHAEVAKGARHKDGALVELLC